MHSFDPLIAARVGVNAAVLYQNIVWWCAKNAANGHNKHEGRFWTYNSVKAWAVLFPYMTAKQIRTALDRLEDYGLILSGCFNASAYDRTKWYCPESQCDLPCRAIEIAQDGEPIPVINTDIKPDIKTEAKASVKKPRRSPLVDLPDAWVPNDTNIADAEKRGFSQQEINDEADRFGNYHRSKQSQFRDWNAAWRTWLSNARKFGKGGGMARQAEPRGYEQGGSIASIVARRRAEGKV